MRERLDALGFRHEPLPRARPAPAIALVRAPNMEREADEISRRILEQAAAGRPFREMAIIVRAADAYVPLLRSTLGALRNSGAISISTRASTNMPPSDF